MVTANGIRVSNVKIDIRRYPDLSLWMKRIYRLKALFSITPQQMAETYAAAATDDTLKNASGKCYAYPLTEVGFSAYAKDPLSIEQVMQLTYRQLGIEPSMSFDPDQP